MSVNLSRNADGYYDETAYAALKSAIRAERELERELRRKKPKPPKVYIASPFAAYKIGQGDNVQTVTVETNVANALKYCRCAVEQGFLPIAPHVYLPRFMNDNDPTERELALSFGMRLMNGCRELWVFGDYVSAGMEREINAAKSRHMVIRKFVQINDKNFEEVLNV